MSSLSCQKRHILRLALNRTLAFSFLPLLFLIFSLPMSCTTLCPSWKGTRYFFFSLFQPMLKVIFTRSLQICRHFPKHHFLLQWLFTSKFSRSFPKKTKIYNQASWMKINVLKFLTKGEKTANQSNFVPFPVKFSNNEAKSAFAWMQTEHFFSLQYNCNKRLSY